MKSGDTAWLTILGGAVVYELVADDLLSMATRRYCTRRPWLTRAVITAIAGHLACALPAQVDVFNANNLLHRWIVKHYPLRRQDRV